VPRSPGIPVIDEPFLSIGYNLAVFDPKR